MDKYKKAILRYELARQEVVNLKDIRSNLLSSCENIEKTEEYNDSITSYDLNGFKEAKTCLAVAWDNMIEWNRDEGLSGYRISYEEVIDMDSLNTFNGVVCGSCHSAYQLKIGRLAKAGKELGYAKSAIAMIGKSLIEELENERN